MKENRREEERGRNTVEGRGIEEETSRNVTVEKAAERVCHKFRKV